MPTCTFLSAGTDETQDTTLFTNGLVVAGSGSSVASASDQAHTGARSLKCVVGAANGAASASTQNATLADAGSAISCWVRFSSVAPSVDTFWLIAATAGIGDDILGVGIDTSGHLVVNGIGQYANRQHGSTALSANTWYRVTMAYVIASVSSWSVTVYLNGVSEVTMSNTQGNLSATATSALLCGVDAFTLTNNVSSILTVWIDDIYVDNRTDKSDPGNISVTAKRPFDAGLSDALTGTGTPSGYGASGGTLNWQYVNERPLNTSNFVSGAGNGITGKTDYYAIEGLSVGDVDLTGLTIQAVMGWLYVNASSSVTGKIIVDGTSTSKTFTASSPPSGTLLQRQLSSTPTVYPAGTGSDIGVTTGGSGAITVSLYECGILVAYIPAAGGAFFGSSLMVIQAGYGNL